MLKFKKNNFCKLLNFENSIIFQIDQFQIFNHFPNSSIIANCEIG